MERAAIPKTSTIPSRFVTVIPTPVRPELQALSPQGPLKKETSFHAPQMQNSPLCFENCVALDSRYGLFCIPHAESNPATHHSDPPSQRGKHAQACLGAGVFRADAKISSNA
jgi:hypothetical protein